MTLDCTDAHGLASFLRSKIRTYAISPELELPDVTSLLMDPQAFQAVINALRDRYAGQQITHVVSCEARGFLFGAPLALALQVPFVPVRRARHLPGKTVGVDFTTGFYSGRLEIHEDALATGARVVVIDDLVATGNTLTVTCELVEKLGGEVVECGCVVRSVRFQDMIMKTPVFGLLTM